MLTHLLSLILPSPAAAIASRLRPNPAAPKLPDQAATGAAQALGGGRLRAGYYPIVGSEPGWYEDQGASTVGFVPLVQDVSASGQPIPPSMLVPGDPGASSAPTTAGAFYWGPVDPAAPWGGQGRTIQNGAQIFAGDALNPPGAQMPTARQMVAGRTAATPPAPAPQAAHDALAYAYGG